MAPLESMWKPPSEGTGAYQIKRRLAGFKSKIAVKRIEESSTQGVRYITNLRDLEDEFGLRGTFSFAVNNYDFEMWFKFKPETLLCVILSITTVMAVVLIITADFIITLVVCMCVVMTDLFLFGHIYYMGLTLNPLTILNIIISMGISVDYSAHIAYAYLVEPIPPDCETPA